MKNTPEDFVEEIMGCEARYQLELAIEARDEERDAEIHALYAPVVEALREARLALMHPRNEWFDTVQNITLVEIGKVLAAIKEVKG